jgi:succinoglycan biosynthesis transport protein ExoP
MLDNGLQLNQKPGFLRSSDSSPYEDRDWQEFGLLQYWRVISKRRAVALITAAVVLGLGTAVLLVIPWNYQSNSRLELNFATTSPLDSLGLPSGAASLLGSNTDSEIGTEINVLQSESVATKVITDLGLYKDPQFVGRKRARMNEESSTRWFDRPREREKEITLFGKLLDVEADSKSFDVDVSFDYPDAIIAHDVVAHLEDLYIQSRFQSRYETVMKTTGWLTGQLQSFKNTVDQSQQALSNFMQEHQIVAAVGGNSGANSATGPLSQLGSANISAGAGSLEVQQLTDLDHQFVQAKSARVVAEAKYRLSQGQDPETMSPIVQDPMLTLAWSQLSNLKVQLSQSESILGSQHPHIIELESQLAEAQKQVDARLAQVRTGFKNDYQASLNNETTLKRELDDYKQYTTSLTNDYLRYDVLKSELESNTSLYQGLKQQLQEAGITASLQATHINVVDPPQIPYKYHSPKFVLVIPALLLFTCILAATAALLRERLDDSLVLPSQVESSTKLPIIGIVPHFTLADRPKHQLGDVESAGSMMNDPSVVAGAPNSPASEAYRSLRSSLMMTSAIAPKMILVTSAIPEEGKSTSSINLATVLAQKGKRVLLVDGDLRKPALHQRFKKPGGAGITGLLTGSVAELAKVVIPVGSTGTLDLLPAGLKPPIPGDLLESDAAKNLFVTMGRDYDFVVVDSPPILAVNDALILGRYVDAVLLVVRARKTPKSVLLLAIRKLMDARVCFKGMVFTDLNYEAPEYKYSAYGYVYSSDYYNS